MQRRQFIVGIGLITLPRIAAAQQTEPIRKIGVLMGIAESDPEGRSRVVALQQGLAEFGWKDPQNIQIDYRWTSGEPIRIRQYADEMVTLGFHAILVTNSASAQALQRTTKSIPIVFVSVSDPVGDGIVASISRPGGNITGFSTYEPGMAGKWIQLLKEVSPTLTRVAVLFDPDTDPHSLYLPALTSAAEALRVKLISAPFRSNSELENAVVSVGPENNGGLVALPGSSTVVHREAIIRLTSRHLIPALYPQRLFVSVGGLMSYGTDTIDQYRQSARYIDRILRGSRPSDLPVQQPTNFRLVINLKTARALNLTVPTTLLARADEVIE